MTTSLHPRFRPTASPERGARPTVSSGVTEPVPPSTAEDRDGAEGWRTSIRRGILPGPGRVRHPHPGEAAGHGRDDDDDGGAGPGWATGPDRHRPAGTSDPG